MGCSRQNRYDIAAERFDAGVRLGGVVSQGMIAVPISGDMGMIAVASPAYLDRYRIPRETRELAGHNCINLRLPTHGGLYTWEFEKDGQELRVRVSGQQTLNTILHVHHAAVRGMGMGFIRDGLATSDLDAGRLVQILAD